jgi:hypothetical protein
VADRAWVALVVEFATDGGDTVRQRAVLAESAPDRKQDSDTQYDIEYRVLPDDGVDRIDEPFELFHAYPVTGWIAVQVRSKTQNAETEPIT